MRIYPTAFDELAVISTSCATAASPDFELLSAYALALIALSLSGPPKALKLISGIGSVLGSLARFWEHAFMYTFGWEYSGLDNETWARLPLTPHM
jgi:hypothetical protein